MAINFPASPSTNDTFTAGSITYKWDGAKWIGLGVTPADRLVEGSNSLEINANNDLVWTGNHLQLVDTAETTASLFINGTKKSSWQAQDNFGTILYSYDGEPIIFSTSSASGFSDKLRIDTEGRLLHGNSFNNEWGGGLISHVPQSITNVYFRPSGEYTASFGRVDNTNTTQYISIDSSYNQNSAVSAGIFLSAHHVDANGSPCGFTIKNLKSDAGGLVFNSVKTATSVGNPATEAERLRVTGEGDLVINNNLTPNHSTQSGSIFITVPSEQSGNPSRGICWAPTSDTHYVKLEPTVIDGLVVNGYSGVAFATGSRSNSTWTEQARITTSGLTIDNDLTVDQANTNVSGVGTSTVSNVVTVGQRSRVNLYQTSSPVANTWYLHIARDNSSRTSGTVEILQHGELGGQQVGNGANYYKALWSSFTYLGPGSLSSVITDNVDAGGNTSRGITGVTVSQSDDEIIYAINSNWYGAIDVIIEWINEGDLQYQLDQTSTAVF